MITCPITMYDCIYSSKYPNWNITPLSPNLPTGPLGATILGSIGWSDDVAVYVWRGHTFFWCPQKLGTTLVSVLTAISIHAAAHIGTPYHVGHQYLCPGTSMLARHIQCSPPGSGHALQCSYMHAHIQVYICACNIILIYTVRNANITYIIHTEDYITMQEIRNPSNSEILWENTNIFFMSEFPNF